MLRQAKLHVERRQGSIRRRMEMVQTGVLHQNIGFKSDIHLIVVPGDPTSGLWPKISEEILESTTDDKIQAYCFSDVYGAIKIQKIGFPFQAEITTP